MASAAPLQIRFGVFELDLRNGELYRSGVRVRLQPQPFKVLALLACRAGNRLEARRALAQLQQLAATRYVPALYFAALYTGLADVAQALAWLNRAYQERSDYLVYLNVEPMADPLRADPQFQKLLRRIGLP